MRPRIIIVGAGFGGIAAAQALRKADADIVLIDRTNHHLFQPLLYQVAGAALSPADIATANRALLRRNRNTRILMAEVSGVDADAREVCLADGRRLPFDHLILATGAAYSFFGNDAWRDHAYVLKSIDDALAIRAAVLGAFERAEQCDDPVELQRLLTFAVVGGGPTGVELAGTIAELARTTLARDFASIDPRAARVVLCEMGGRILTVFDPPLSQAARAMLESLGVEVRTGAAVQAIDARGLTVGDQRIDAAAVLWAAGTEARPVARWLSAAAAKNGAVKVAPDCSIPGHPAIFAIGDVASFDGGDGPLPGLAPVAKQQGRFVGKLIAARIAGRPAPDRFRYRDYGTMAVIGRSRAVAEIGGMKLKGFVAWLAWSLVHLMLLVDFRSRVSVYVHWAWSWFTYGRGARLLTGYAPEPGEKPRTAGLPEIEAEARAAE
ncbi:MULTISPECIES: NAD(P)/FAD-dependent oxidoreductase [unclassified Sphingomonas]|uniref:NAD(P)/FAD-dependent oxidoreductase n=1 Tax=unclassified Sphingomonas TaxID=196159 RepID=UPI000700CB9B|nr:MULTISPECIES: NAD(P)/FAD-dependent oxidoreductase [unclassified Sphingomonas]KQM61359.1 pyridine nucleotide-disulfide oxidoreductase [Sphingomonas sp. Leaf16]KQN12454.1 pyridine nucleotide-disulfide oxidoreductase [Sphingomonas sp. Leaf29]KQN18935.1 pyridine nucleotide-disulfide oxidoreductase [Sphingomonas sp. Leaf32]